MPNRPAKRSRRPLAWWWLAVLFAALLPSLDLLSVPLISDDGAILGYVHENGALHDWTSSQYDLHAVRFWRPLVTTSFAVQEGLTGVESLYLRLFNLVGHAISAVLLGLLAMRLGASRVGALLAGLLCAWFPEQGGNVIWIAGRVDSLCLPWLLLGVLLAVDRRPVLALSAGFLALASKELAVVMPVWIALLVWAQGERPLEAFKRALPMGGLVLGVGVWRRLALGTWVGGYQSQDLGAHLLPTTLHSLQALATALGPECLLLAACLMLSRGKLWKRRNLALLFCVLAAALPLLHVLSSGSVPPEHARTLWLADCALVLSIASCFQRGSTAQTASATAQRSSGVVALLLVMLFAAYRGSLARQNLLDWSTAAELAETQIAQARSAVAGDARTRSPALSPNFSRTTESGAYVLHWGIADRFRAPFEICPRPVWPWRPVFEIGGPDVFRELCFELERGVARPVDERRRRTALLPVAIDGSLELRPLRIDSSLVLKGDASDSSPRLSASLADDQIATAWELVFVCELGYRTALVAGASTGLEFSLREAILQVSDAFILAVDFHGQAGYLELRALDRTGQVLASSAWLELNWNREELKLWR